MTRAYTFEQFCLDSWAAGAHEAYEVLRRGPSRDAIVAILTDSHGLNLAFDSSDLDKTGWTTYQLYRARIEFFGGYSQALRQGLAVLQY